MTRFRNKAKRESFDECYRCIGCGKGDRGRDKLELIQSGGHWTNTIWAHGHCVAEIQVKFAARNLKKAQQCLHQANFDASGTIKCLEKAIDDLRCAKGYLTAKN
jgi:hypothetical protein